MFSDLSFLEKRVLSCKRLFKTSVRVMVTKHKVIKGHTVVFPQDDPCHVFSSLCDGPFVENLATMRILFLCEPGYRDVLYEKVLGGKLFLINVEKILHCLQILIQKHCGYQDVKIKGFLCS